MENGRWGGFQFSAAIEVDNALEGEWLSNFRESPASETGTSTFQEVRS